MGRLSSTAVAALAKALSEAYRSAPDLDMLLHSLDGRRFDDLTSKYLPLATNAWEIATKAQEQGWSAELLRQALEDKPNNRALRALADETPTDAVRSDVSLSRNPIDRPSLLCGRGDQWNHVCQCAPTRVHQVILVPGGRGQDPVHFRDRVQVWLAPEPTRSMVAVHWPSPPTRLDALLEPLALALQTDVRNLERTIVERLAHRNLVLLHSCLSTGFTAKHFTEYYTEWWPAAIGTAPTPFHVKCIQPVEWPIVAEGRSLWRRLWPGEEPATEAESEARALIEGLSKKQGAMRIVAVEELVNLEPREIKQFLEASEFRPEQQAFLASQLSGGPQVPAFMFKTIDDYWREVSGIR
jgi:hypothetical protein